MAVASLFEDLLDQYKIEQHVAEKRYSDLYWACDVDDDRPVRLDVLRRDYAEDSSFAGRFINRARALAQVHHPNIARVLHIGKDAAGAPYVAQAIVDGYSLAHRLEQLAEHNTTANPLYALKLIRQLTDALLLAERLEIFHYDLQPDNVLLRNVTLPADDTVVLIDLFIPPERNTTRSAPGGDEAKRGYLPPEQRGGKDITAAGQVYSLSAMLYHLLAGSIPDRSATIVSSTIDRLLNRATALERARPGLSSVTYQLVDRGLRKDPRGRFPTIESFSAALDRAQAAEETRLSAAVRPVTTTRKPRLWLVPLLILALFLTIGAVAMRGVNTRDLFEQNATLHLTATSLSSLLGGVSAGDATPTLAPTLQSVAPTETAATSVTAAGTQPEDAAAPAVTETVEVLSVATEQGASPTPEPSATTTPSPEPSATHTPEPSPVAPRVRVMHNLVNLRSGPGVAYPQVGIVTGGEFLEVVAHNNDPKNLWYLVVTPDKRIAWISTTVIQAENPDAMAAIPVAATLPPTPSPSPTPTATPTIAITPTILPTTSPGEPGGGGGGTPLPPPEEPTAAPTTPATPPIEPSFTPPALPTDSP